MIGFILYEAFDLMYHVGKMGYNGVNGVYRWYYKIPSTEDQKDDKIKSLEEKIKTMEENYSKLEHLIKDTTHVSENDIITSNDIQESSGNIIRY